MNKKDVETIGYLMTTCRSREEIVRGLIQLDPRIKDEIAIQEEISGKDEATSDRFDELMIQEYGPNWCWLRKELIPRKKEIWQQAYNEIRGINQ